MALPVPHPCYIFLFDFLTLYTSLKSPPDPDLGGRKGVGDKSENVYFGLCFQRNKNSLWQERHNMGSRNKELACNIVTHTQEAEREKRKCNKL